MSVPPPSPLRRALQVPVRVRHRRIIRPLPDAPPLTPLHWLCEPLDLLRAWPPGRPLTALVSMGGGGERARWSIFAAPVAGQSLRIDPGDGSAGLGAIRSTLAAPPCAPGRRSGAPFRGGWIGWLSYDIGRMLEPTAAARKGEARAATDRDWPLVVLHRCPSAYLHDGATGRWFRVGDPRLLPDPEFDAQPLDASVSTVDPGPSEAAYRSGVARGIELIRAGDIYQANLAHRLTARFSGSARVISERLLRAGTPWYGAHIESGVSADETREVVVSASPELFLRFDADTRRVVTRPIKGTRSAAEGARSLMDSAKDGAELAMIVDLMRNDLGRVCETGSVAVDDPRSIESHASGTILHGVATVSGTLRRDRTLFDLLAATFPPGSVTGAPKVRAMQVIDTLEPVRRGPYCGAVGYISDTGDACFNVAIRTAALRLDSGSSSVSGSGTIDLSVGAGIVADSDPAAEWVETLHKADALIGALSPRAEVVHP